MSVPRDPVCFFTGTMEVFAGAERATATLANALARRGWRVHILCQYGETSVFPLESGVTLHAMYAQCPSFKRLYLQAVARLRTFVREHRIGTLIDVDTNLAWFSLPALAGLGIRHIAWEHTHIGQDLGRRSRRVARWLAARYAEAVVVLTERDRAAWQAALRPRAQLVAIPNPLAIDRPAEPTDLSQRRVLAVGRLEHVKGFDLLLAAWQGVTAQTTGWTLRIVGDGSERESLLRQREALGLQRCVEILPATHDIAAHYGQASVFAMSSRYEGFGLVLTEAMACGLAIVSFACETGPRALLSDDVTGLLVEPENVEALAQTLLRVMRSQPLRERLSQAARQASLAYDAGAIAAQWEKYLR